MNRCALYHRVSTRDQDPAGARAELRRAAAARDLEVALDVEETGSGARNDRPGLARVLAAVRRHEVSAVLVWKLDRFGRSTVDLLTNVHAIVDAGARFVATSQGLDLKPGGDALSGLILTVLAGVAEFERELIGERTRVALDKRRREGKPLGRPARNRHLTPERVDELRARGLSLPEVAAMSGTTLGGVKWVLRKRRETDPGSGAAKRAKRKGAGSGGGK